MSVNLQISVGVHHADGLGWISPGLEARKRGERGSENWIWEGSAVFVPEAGEVITFAHPRENDESDMVAYAMGVKQRSLAIGPNGGTVVDLALVDWHVDPSEQIAKHCKDSYRRAWYTEEDGDIDAVLTACGFYRSSP